VNASQLLKFRQRLQLANESLFPATIKIGDDPTEYVATTGGLHRGGVFVQGGSVSEDEIAFHVRKDVLPQPPEIGVSITWVERNEVFRFANFGDNSDNDARWRLVCESNEPK